MNSIERKEYNKKYLSFDTPEGRRHREKKQEIDRECKRKYRSMNPELKADEYHRWILKNFRAYRVLSLINHRIVKGEIVRQPCEICGKLNTYAHHDDYSEVEEIRWLCPSHDKLWHMNNKTKNNN